MRKHIVLLDESGDGYEETKSSPLDSNNEGQMNGISEFRLNLLMMISKEIFSNSGTNE